MFALVDVNNMYVSCERVFRPALNGRPVVVLSNNDGACIARSNEAKELGIKMAQPVAGRGLFHPHLNVRTSRFKNAHISLNVPF